MVSPQIHGNDKLSGSAYDPEGLCVRDHLLWWRKTPHFVLTVLDSLSRGLQTLTGGKEQHAKRTARAKAPSGRDRQRCPHCQDRDRRRTRDKPQAASEAQQRFGGREGASGEYHCRQAGGDFTYRGKGPVGIDMDTFLYSGPIERGYDLDFADFVSSGQNSDSIALILCTPGGSPDAAYKMGRYLQARYEHFRLLVPGFCKSAGTLLAIAAEELVFSPYGELGPLDVQMAKTDNIAGLESGLNISEAFLALERRAKETFHDLVVEIISASGGIVSFQTASHSASEIVAALYGPIFARIDPEEVGSRSRAMRIGEDYGKRLSSKFRNLKPSALGVISQSYSSHGFVIDMEEASGLFERVRDVNEQEKQLIEALGRDCRVPCRELRMENLTEKLEDTAEKENIDGSSASKAENSGSREKSKGKSNGGDPAGASPA